MKPEQIKRKLGELSEKARENGRKALKWFQVHGKIATVAAALAIVLIALASGGDGKGKDDGENAGGGTSELMVSPAQAASTAQAMGERRTADQSAGDQTITDQSAAGNQAADGQSRLGTARENARGDAGGQNNTEAAKGPALEKDQIEILDSLTSVLTSRDLEAGGEMLLDNEQKLEYLFYQVMKGEQYLYRDGELYRDLNGEGLVMKRPMSVYYGTLQNGRPEGAGAALQGIELDGKRYDYADGNWKNGKLNGEAIAGYRYLNGSGDGESQAVKRTGIFTDDLMTGAFTYETVSSGGETTVWDMEAEAGRTKLDDRWIHDTEKQYYYLPSTEISSHTYVLPDDEAEYIRWRNMLLWEE